MNPDSKSTALANEAWGCMVAKSLVDLGIGTVVFSPGSRSTPLVLGCENQVGLETIPILDERTAGFFALGLSKRLARPTALICTSGSAVANWFPAVVEADHSGTPLLLLSADRPPELQDCGAGQTINQVELFGRFTRAFHQIPLPSQSLESLKALAETINLAHSQSMGQNPGPVHLNFPFREPLFTGNGQSLSIELPSTPFQATKPKEEESNKTQVLGILAKSKRLLVVAGEHAPAQTFESWTGELSPPILCDSLSPLRESGHPNAVLRFENLLRNEGFLKNAEPDLILQVGPLPTSKTLRNWLGELHVPRVVLEPRGINVDPLDGPSQSFDLSYSKTASMNPPVCEKGWSDLWMKSDGQVEARFDRFFSEEDNWFEGKVARVLSQHVPKESCIQVANSMPIRDLEWFWKGNGKQRRLFGNRGANGIDGTLGTALGLAHKNSKATYLLTGELAFLHDSNALLASSILSGSLTVILLNNGGGGIFENLPVAKLSAFEKCFATPQNCDFKILCKAHGVAHHEPKDRQTLIDLLQAPPKQGMQVLEIKTDRKKDRLTRLDLLGFGPDL
jgi:2-succinyl-5-enolpyruvyl-6-hydroxy-3-cyclohexene-1-carboxylate synthase